MISRRALLRAGGGLATAFAIGGTATAAATADLSRLDLSLLGGSLQGDLVLPSDAGYPLAKQLQIAEFDAVNPAAIAYCETAADVRQCLLFAQEHGIHVTPRSGGHNFAGWSTTTGLVIDLSRIRHVTVGSSTIRVGPGIQSVDAVEALRPHGKQIATGLCPTVCPGGFLTGGGIGWQTRKFGIASDRLVSATVVLPSGKIVRASSSQYTDLFWALRGGGGGNFGVVVDFEVRPTQVPRAVTFTATWPWDASLRVLEAWQPWSDNASVNLASSVGVVLMDAAAGNQPFVLLQGAYLGPQAELESALNQLYAAVGASPASKAVQDLPYDKAMMQLFGCENMPVDECHRVGTNPEALLPRQGLQRERHRLFARPIDATGLDEALTAFDADRQAGELRYLGFTALGGVANLPSRTSTAYVHRDARFLARYTVVRNETQPTPEQRARAEAWADRGFGVLDPLSNGGAYVNFPDPALTDWAKSYYGENYPRLLEVKKRYDPGNVFRFQQSIGS